MLLAWICPSSCWISSFRCRHNVFLVTVELEYYLSAVSDLQNYDRQYRIENLEEYES